MKFRVRVLCGLITTLFLGCGDDEIPPAVLCRVASMTDQLEVSGKLTDQMQRTFTYTNGQLTGLNERNTDRQVNLTVEYDAAIKATKASDGATNVLLAYTSPINQPTSATLTRSGAVQATYEMAYNTANKLTRVLETRQVIPSNSLVRAREYIFTYDADGLLKTERLVSTLTDRSTVEQETDYTYGTLINPMGSFTQSGLLTVVALSQLVETMPGRFWQGRAVQEYKTWSFRNGTRSTLRETATFITKMDENGRLSGQEQNTVSISGSGQTTQRKNQHSFLYECQ